MADYHANIIPIYYGDIMVDILDDYRAGIYRSYKYFFEKFFVKVRNTQGITAGEIESGTDYVRLRLPSYDGTYSDDAKVYLMVVGDHLDNYVKNDRAAGFRIGISIGSSIPNKDTFGNQNYFLYRDNTLVTNNSLSLLVSPYSEDFSIAKLMIIQENIPYINGYRLACGANSRNVGSNMYYYDIYDYDFLDAVWFYYITKGIHSVTKEVTPIAVCIELDAINVEDTPMYFLDDRQYTRSNINVMYVNQQTVPDSDICYARMFNRGYYAENIYINGHVTTTNDDKGGGNNTLHGYLYQNYDDLNIEYSGITKDGIMINSEEYCGLIHFRYSSYSPPSSYRILFKKNQST